MTPPSVERVELRRVAMPLVRPFRTAFGTQADRDVLLVHVTTTASEGWGEVVTPAEPVYSAEYTDGAADVLARHLLPRLLTSPSIRAADVAGVLAPIKGHRMAKAALEAAVLDAELRAAGRSFADTHGGVRDRVECGVSVGIPAGGIPELLDQVAGYLEDGYRRIKLKVEPGFDIEPVAAVRDRWPEVALQVDANCAYTSRDREHLRRFDEFGLLLIEQPYPEERLLEHADLAAELDTPICLDESILDLHVARDAITVGACDIVNIKAGRVGGYLEAVRIHDVCRSRDVPVWCGGMLETGIGRGGNVALASLPGFTLPGDTSASSRYFAEDLTEPFVLDDGHLEVPREPGLSRLPRPEVLDVVTTDVRTFVPGREPQPS